MKFYKEGQKTNLESYNLIYVYDGSVFLFVFFWRGGSGLHNLNYLEIKKVVFQNSWLQCSKISQLETFKLAEVLVFVKFDIPVSNTCLSLQTDCDYVMYPGNRLNRRRGQLRISKSSCRRGI